MINRYLNLNRVIQLVILIISAFIILFLFTLLYSDAFRNICFLNKFAIEPYLFHDGSSFIEFYQRNLRGYLFSGFISVGSFLLSLHSFVITNMRDKHYLTKEYEELYVQANNCKKGEINKSDLLKPLDNLSWFINWSIVLALLTAIFQFTLGLYTNAIPAIICVYFAILTIIFMLKSLFLIRINIKAMLFQNGTKKKK